MLISNIPGVGRISAFLRKFIGAKSGNTAMIFALSLIPVAGIIGAGLDYTLAITSRGKMQSASDAAALAAAKAMGKNPAITDAQLQTIVNSTFQNNTTALYQTKDINITMNRLAKGVRVDANAKVETNIIRILGFNEIDIAVFSETIASFTKIELALVLDNTGSMGWSGKMEALKAASNDLVDALIPADAPPDLVKISIIPYDVTVNVGPGYKTSSWLAGETPAWCGLVKPSNTDYIPDVSPPSIAAYNISCGSLPDIQTLTGSTNVLKTKISQMSANGWTYIPAGLMWGWRAIDPNKPFTQAKPYSDPDWQKIIVLMTDGANTAKWSNGKLFTNQAASQADAKTKILCEDIKNKDIRVFTIAFALSSSTAKKMLKNCATTEADFFATHTSEELKNAFAAIAGSINKMRLTK